MTDPRAAVEVTGLRNPCAQIDAFQLGLMHRLIGTDDADAPVFLAGVMGIVLEGGEVTPGDAIRVTLPLLPHEALRRV